MLDFSAGIRHRDVQTTASNREACLAKSFSKTTHNTTLEW